MAKQNLGMVTAYAYAVVGGYEGTEAEFEALLGNIATDLAEIENLTVIANTLPPGSSATASYDHGVLTLGIPKGDKGDTGAGATVTAGTTATGNPGTDASVTNSGTTKDAVFNFTIPRGDTGNGIERIELTDTQGAVKTYTIYFTDPNVSPFDFEVTDGEVTNDTLTAVLTDYAKIDGAYESMTVGNAEQLVSTVFVNDEEPYNFRTSGGSADIGDREYDTVVGGTVAWNQLIKNGNFADSSEWLPYNDTNLSISISGGECTATILSVKNNNYANCIKQQIPKIAGHKYITQFDIYVGKQSRVTTGYMHNGTTEVVQTGWNRVGSVQQAEATGTAYVYLGVSNASDYGYAVNDTYKMKNVNIIDLTQMFGSTIADYIYSLEQANTGAGVAWFRKLFPKPYYAYDSGTLKSVSDLASHDMVGFNAFDEELELGGCNQNGNYADNNKVRSKNYIPVVDGQTYYVKSSKLLVFYGFDADKNGLVGCFSGYTTVTRQNQTLTIPNGVKYLRFYYADNTIVANDICINLSWDGERDGEYEPYVKHSYPLDSDLTLRGIPKLDASNNLYYDGDIYPSDGNGTERFTVVDLGTLNYSDNGQTANVQQFVTFGIAKKNGTLNFICDNYVAEIADRVGTVAGRDATNAVVFNAPLGTDVATFKASMSGHYMAYEKATPTAFTADPFQSPQIVDDFGTEEYVGSPIPVGHKTKYTNNLRAKLEMSPNSPDGAGDYLVRQTNGINEYVSLSSNATIQDMLARIEALEGGGE